MAHPYDVLRAELSRDGSRPFATFYDDATGERVELSVATFDNWVAKTAGLLRDGLGAQPGDRVALLLPPHWQALVWACACWAVGTTVVAGADAAKSADVAIVGPDTLEAAAEVPEVVAVSLLPLGGRFTEALPAGVLDYAVEVPAYPDRLTPYLPPSDGDPALEVDGVRTSFGALTDTALQHATALGAGSGARLLVPADDLVPALNKALLVPLAIGGSAVLVRHEDPKSREARMAAERAGVLAT
ncbi:MAG TPA: TIGR03089 family protein [Jiangellaceae bacterium]